MYYLLIFALLFVIELVYFRIAFKFNIIDKPNNRSSHSQLTLRGGGIIFPLSVFLFFLLSGFPYPWFMLGVAAISIISFADDIREQSRWLRLLVHLLAAGLLLYQTGVFQVNLYWWVIGFVLLTGLVNAANFMDGINGITPAYAFTVLAALFILNRQVPIIHEKLILFLALGNAVFLFFNFRKKARCFAGDVGSISMAYGLLFIITLFVIQSGNGLPLLLYAVYAIDSGLTILHRLAKGENISQPHRQHLYQYLANEKKWPHLGVSSLYMLVQAVISAGVVLLWKKEPTVQLVYAAIVLALLAATYIVAKRKMLYP